MNDNKALVFIVVWIIGFLVWAIIVSATIGLAASTTENVAEINATPVPCEWVDPPTYELAPPEERQ